MSTFSDWTKQDLLDIMSDLSKDAYGFRVRNVNWSAMTLEELIVEANNYSAISKEAMEQEELWAAKKLEEFEATLQSVIDSGAGDELTALHWIIDAEEEMIYDLGYFMYSIGVHDIYSGRGAQLAQSVQQILSESKAA